MLKCVGLGVLSIVTLPILVVLCSSRYLVWVSSRRRVTSPVCMLYILSATPFLVSAMKSETVHSAVHHCRSYLRIVYFVMYRCTGSGSECEMFQFHIEFIDQVSWRYRVWKVQYVVWSTWYQYIFHRLKLYYGTRQSLIYALLFCFWLRFLCMDAGFRHLVQLPSSVGMLPTFAWGCSEAFVWSWTLWIVSRELYCLQVRMHLLFE